MRRAFAVQLIVLATTVGVHLSALSRVRFADGGAYATCVPARTEGNSETSLHQAMSGASRGLKLTGIILVSGNIKSTRAILASARGSSTIQKAYKIGEHTPGGCELVRVCINRIELKCNGGRKQ